MSYANAQLFVVLLAMATFYYYLGLYVLPEQTNSSAKERLRRVAASSKGVFYYLIRSFSIKVDLDLIAVAKVYGLGILINFLAFDFLETEPQLRLRDHEVFIMYVIFICLVKLDRIEEVGIFKKSLEIISDIIFLLLISAQYFLVGHQVSGPGVAICYGLLLCGHFCFSYLFENEGRQRSLLTKLIDFQCKAGWFLLMLSIFAQENSVGFYNLSWELVLIFLALLGLSSVLEKETNKIVFKQSISIYRRYYLAAVVLTSIGSVLIAYLY